MLRDSLGISTNMPLGAILADLAQPFYSMCDVMGLNIEFRCDRWFRNQGSQIYVQAMMYNPDLMSRPYLYRRRKLCVS